MCKLSIIIPVYNVEPYVGKTLNSVFETAAPTEDFEVIVVNDGTKDGSMGVVHLFGDRPNLKILEQDNQGLSAARTRGLSVAQGDFIWFVDSDDWLVEDGVGKVLSLLKERPDADVLMFPLQHIVVADPSKNRLDYQFSGETAVSGIEVMRDLGLYIWCAPRFVFKRSFTKDDRLFFPLGMLHEDEYFCPVLMYLSSRVYIFDWPVYNRYLRPGSIMTTIGVRSAYDTVSIHRLLIQFMERNLPHSEWSWFRRQSMDQLETSYSFNKKNFGSSEFKRFACREGFYVWREWLPVNRDKTLRRKFGQLFFYLMPDLKTKYSRWMNSNRYSNC